MLFVTNLTRNSVISLKTVKRMLLLFGRGPNRVMKTACFDAIRANVNKQVNKRSEANVCHVNAIQHYIFSFIVFLK